MKKKLLFALCIFLILFVGCGQQPNSSKSINGLRADLQEQAQTAKSPSDLKDNSKIISSTSPSKMQDNANVVEIKEKMFIQQCDDIYMNSNDYKDKIIKLEGMYQEYTDASETYHIIYRKSPGCCGNDGEVGFQFTYNGEMPKPNDWIKVAGTIEVVKNSNGYEDIILHVTKLEVSDERGAEFVAY